MRRLLISSFVPGIKGGATLNERNPIASNCGSISSRPANSPHSVSGIAPASATMMPSSRSSEAECPESTGSRSGRPDHRERVLREIVGADAEEIDMLGDRRHVKGCGRCLNHSAKRRALLQAELGAQRLEELRIV